MTWPAESLPTDLSVTLLRIGLRSTAADLDALLAQADRLRWSPRNFIAEIANAEAAEKGRRSLERRLRNARIGRFKLMADFDWLWPKKIDRPLIERALTLQFIREKRNLVLIGPNGLGKTMIAKNIAYAAIVAGHSVLFRSASDILAHLADDSFFQRRRKLTTLARPDLLCIDEIGYLAYDTAAADLLYEIVNRRYESRSILVTTNRSFRDWGTVFPNATSIATLLDRLTHHADATVIEGHSYRVHESELESAARNSSPVKESPHEP
jgi:DNA replication protein DnaC